MDNEKVISTNDETKEEIRDIVICEHCGKEIDKNNDEWFETSDGEIICYDCYDTDYFTCEICGEIHRFDDGIQSQDTERWACEDCASANWTCCEDCGEWYQNTDYGVWIGNGDYWVCERCEDNYCYCEGCDRMIPNDNMHYCESDGNYYCDDCIDEMESQNIIKSYHEHKHEFVKKRTDTESKTPLYFGFELEVEQKSWESTDTEDMAKMIDDKMGNLVVFEHDGSLSDGFEIISQPMTLKYINENKKLFENMLQLLIENGYISHNSEHCGLHIHLSRNYFTPNEIDKFQLILEKFKKELVIFSRRGESQQHHWAKFISDNHNVEDKLDINYIKKYKDKHDRYFALNLTNNDTIEFRLLRGTLKYNTFLASFELLNNISKIVKNTSAKNIDKLSFESIINYGRNNKHLKQYCVEKNLIKGGI